MNDRRWDIDSEDDGVEEAEEVAAEHVDERAEMLWAYQRLNELCERVGEIRRWRGRERDDATRAVLGEVLAILGGQAGAA